jgi:hypothetical protein
MKHTCYLVEMYLSNNITNLEEAGYTLLGTVSPLPATYCQLTENGKSNETTGTKPKSKET